MAAGRKWTLREDALLLDWRDNKNKQFAEIGIEIDRRAPSCATRYWVLRGPQNKSAIRSVADIDHEKYAGELQSILAERDRREAARILRDEHADASGILTSIACGDPLPGYSALDKRRAGA